MGEQSDIRAEAVATALRRHYGIETVSLELVPGGEDPAAWVFRVEAGAASAHLVKVRKANGSRDVAAAVARYLFERGLPHVVAPIRSKTGLLTVEDGELSLTVYPFVEGRTGVEAGLVERHWVELGRLARRLHSSALPSDLSEQLATESFRPAELDLVRKVDRAVAGGSFTGRLAEEVAAFWTSRRAEILGLVERTESLGPRVEQLRLPLVLCHADLHTWNVMIDDDGELWLIDWDEVIRAPKERDLMFVVGGIGAGLVDPHETEWFFAGYGETEIVSLALSYYRHAWAVQDIGSYADSVFLAPSLEAESRVHAARILRGLFDPGGIVDLAR